MTTTTALVTRLEAIKRSVEEAVRRADTGRRALRRPDGQLLFAPLELRERESRIDQELEESLSAAWTALEEIRAEVGPPLPAIGLDADADASARVELEAELVLALPPDQLGRLVSIGTVATRLAEVQDDTRLETLLRLSIANKDRPATLALVPLAQRTLERLDRVDGIGSPGTGPLRSVLSAWSVVLDGLIDERIAPTRPVYTLISEVEAAIVRAGRSPVGGRRHL